MIFLFLRYFSKSFSTKSLKLSGSVLADANEKIASFCCAKFSPSSEVTSLDKYKSFLFPTTPKIALFPSSKKALSNQ